MTDGLLHHIFVGGRKAVKMFLNVRIEVSLHQISMERYLNLNYTKTSGSTRKSGEQVMLPRHLVPSMHTVGIFGSRRRGVFKMNVYEAAFDASLNRK